MNKKKTKQFDEFLKYVVKLQPEEFLGVCSILTVPLAEAGDEEKPIPRKFDQVFYEVLVNFEKLNRNGRRELLHLLKASQKKGN